MPQEDDLRPELGGSVVAAVAGLAFAASLLALRKATILPAGVFDGTAAALAGLGLAPLAHRQGGALVGTLTRGVGLVAGTLLFTLSLVAPWNATAPPLALLVAGGALAQAATGARRGALLWIAAFVLLAAGWGYGWWLAGALPEPDRLERALLLGAGASALLLGARALALRRGWPNVLPGPAGLLLVAATGATYLAYRSAVAQRVGNLPLYEWSLGVALSLVLLARLRKSAQKKETEEAWASDAQRHAPDESPIADARMGPLAAAIARYLETGEGFEEYRAALGRANPDALPRLRQVLPAPIPNERGRAARRLAAHQRQSAHRAALEALQAPSTTLTRSP